MTKTNGGPAFPTTQYANGIAPSGHDLGMTLRDYFAAKALAGLPDHVKSLQIDHRIRIAEWCYGMADAMLAAREAA